MTLEEAVAKDQGVMSGTLCFRGTRVPVSTLFAHIEKGVLDAFYEDFPGVTQEMVDAVLAASERLLDQAVLMKRSA